MKDELSCSGSCSREVCEVTQCASWDVTGKPRAGGVAGRPPGRCFARKMLSVQQQPAKLSGLGSGSCLQPSPAVERGWCAGSSRREVFTRTCCLVAQIISVFRLLRGIWPLGFAFSFIYFCLFSILFVNTNILSHPERFLPSLKIPSSSPSTACRLLPAPASPYALCCTYLALSIPSLLNSCSSSSRIPSTILIYIVPLVLCTTCFLHLTCSVLSLLLLKHVFKHLRYGMRP